MLEKLVPSVSKHWLLLAAGITWSLVGGMLCWLAESWLSADSRVWAIAATVVGLIASIIIYRFGFLKIAQKNRSRLEALNRKVCFFAFYTTKSYLLVIVMMAMGMGLRSSPIPKDYLAVLYLVIGAALFFSSLHYYRPAYESYTNQ